MTACEGVPADTLGELPLEVCQQIGIAVASFHGLGPIQESLPITSGSSKEGGCAENKEHTIPMPFFKDEEHWEETKGHPGWSVEQPWGPFLGFLKRRRLEVCQELFSSASLPKKLALDLDNYLPKVKDIGGFLAVAEGNWLEYHQSYFPPRNFANIIGQNSLCLWHIQIVCAMLILSLLAGMAESIESISDTMRILINTNIGGPSDYLKNLRHMHSLVRECRDYLGWCKIFPNFSIKAAPSPCIISIAWLTKSCKLGHF